ncbi:MBL fold metallo-hydrolase [Dactylosporangium sp. NPDC000244]|uniref:ComEC/Rec2 family competence protein n=1 Tax=Dactylosporangium sp. NPDC000244 TaxID=3154365 RepID=UPI003323666A
MMTLEFMNARHGDCCLLSWADGQRVVLIDGGPSATYDEVLGPRLASQPHLDAICVSHIDDDHIAGVLRLLHTIARDRDDGLPDPIHVTTLWFNGLDELVDSRSAGLSAAVRAQNEAPGPSAPIGASYQQGQELHRLARLLQLTGNAPFHGPLIHGAQTDLDGLRITVITPDETALAALTSKWREASEGNADSVITAAIKDRSVPNLSSISLHFDLDGRTALLTGDARSDHLLTGLTAAGLRRPGQPFYVDVLKLPHHGSAKNVTKDFFRHVQAAHYVVSADGAKNHHPDPETLDWLVSSRLSTDRYTVHLTNHIAHAVDQLKRLQQARSFAIKVRTDPELAATIRIG